MSQKRLLKATDGREGLRLLAKEIHNAKNRNNTRIGKSQGIYCRIADIYIDGALECIEMLRGHIKQIERIERKLYQHKMHSKPARKCEINHG